MCNRQAFIATLSHVKGFADRDVVIKKVPDFITEPTRFDSHQAAKAINDDYRKDFNVR